MTKYKTLLLLLLVVFIKQLVWIAYIPLWQFPDEQAHFAQVQNTVENKKIKTTASATTSREIYESERILYTLRDEIGNNRYTYHPEFNIPYAQSKIGLFENYLSHLNYMNRSQMVIKESTMYPQLYYQGDSFFYRAVFNQDLFARVFASRLFNVFIFIFITLAVFEIGKIFYIKYQYSLLLAIVVSFHPMFSFVAGGVNSDNLFSLWFTIGILICFYVIKQGWSKSKIFAMVAIYYLASVTKPQSMILLAIYAFPFFYQLIHSNKYRKIQFFILILVFVSAGGYIYHKISLGQEFIPEIASGRTVFALFTRNYLSFITQSVLHTYKETLPWYWGVFRWLSLTYPRWVYRTINLVLVSSIVGNILYFVRKMRKKAFQKTDILLLFSFYCVAVYYWFITTFDYLFVQTYHYSLGIQGRYFFPIISVTLLLLINGLSELLNICKIPSFIVRVLPISFILLHTYAFMYVVTSYYNSNSLKYFFLQASQYKPEFFKLPYLPLYLVLYFLGATFLIWHVVKLRSTHAST